MKLYIGIDGGASSTRGVLIDQNGKTLEKIIIKKGTNLKAYEELAPKRIIELKNGQVREEQTFTQKDT